MMLITLKLNYIDFFKKECIDVTDGNFWEVTSEVLGRIEGPHYLENKEKHNIYLKANPYVAKKRFINLKGAS